MQLKEWVHHSVRACSVACFSKMLFKVELWSSGVKMDQTGSKGASGVRGGQEGSKVE